MRGRTCGRHSQCQVRHCQTWVLTWYPRDQLVGTNIGPYLQQVLHCQTWVPNECLCWVLNLDRTYENRVRHWVPIGCLCFKCGVLTLDTVHNGQSCQLSAHFITITNLVFKKSSFVLLSCLFSTPPSFARSVFGWYIQWVIDKCNSYWL